VTRKSISEKTLTRRDFMRKSHSAKMNGLNSISLAANFDAPISRHTHELYPQTTNNRAFPKSPPPPVPVFRRRRVSRHRPGQRGHETQIRSVLGLAVETVKNAKQKL
jgi:hypothetical protein